MASRFTRRAFCTRLAAGAAALAVGPLGFGARAAGRKLNILMMVAEDMGPQLGCYGDGCARTPNLDRLAAEGVRFENAWVTQASCSPSRSSIFTGLFPHQTNQLGLSHRGYRMHRGIPSLPALLKEAGYRTGVLGKVHVEPESDVPFDYYGSRKNGTSEPVRTNDAKRTAEACRAYFSQSGEEPFFLSVNFVDTHRPFADQKFGYPETAQGPDDVKAFPFLGPDADTPELRRVYASYYNGVARVDAQVGMILKALEETGHAEDTLVFFIGDHGPAFARGKLSCYEAGLRIPYLVRWPGVSKAGGVSRALVSTVDFLPTCLDAAGAGHLTPSVGEGASLRPLLGDAAGAGRPYLFGEYNSHGASSYFPRRAVRDGRYKLILNLRQDIPNSGVGPDGCEVWKAVSKDKAFEGKPIHALLMRCNRPPRIEFYDLQSDPWEMKNLAEAPEAAAERARLEKALEDWRRRTHDPLLDPKALEAMIAWHDEQNQAIREKQQEIADPKKRAAAAVIDMAPQQRDWKEVTGEWGK